MRRLGLTYLVVLSLSIAGSRATDPSHFTGTALVYTNSVGEIVVNLDQAPADGYTDVSIVFRPNTAVTGGLTPATYTVTADYFSGTTQRFVLDDVSGALHLDLAAGYVAVSQPASNATTSVVRQGSVLLFRTATRSLQATSAYRLDATTEQGVGDVAFASHVTKFTNGTISSWTTVALRLPDSNGVDTVVQLTPSEVTMAVGAAQSAFNRALSGGYSPTSCYDDCMDDRDCEVAGAIGAGVAAAVAERMALGPIGGPAAVTAGALSCWGANSVGCSIGCNPVPPQDPLPACQAGSSCQLSCSGGEEYTGECSMGNAPAMCCATLCSSPFIC